MTWHDIAEVLNYYCDWFHYIRAIFYDGYILITTPTSTYYIYREGEEDEEGDGDEDWIEPGRLNNRRKRDKNSPKR